MHGLGFTAREFWAMTPREFEAHERIAEKKQDLTLDMFADIQVALHNGPLTRKDGGLWTREMFRASTEKAVIPEDGIPAWKRERDAMQANIQRAKGISLVGIPDKETAAEMVGERSRRAAQARKDGYPREVIQKILMGVA